MLQMLTLSNFRILYQDYDGNRDHNVLIEFVPKTHQETSIWGNAPTRLLLPYTHGLIDTTITDTEYMCTILVDSNNISYLAKSDVLLGFFTKIMSTEIKEISTTEPAKMPQIIDAQVGDKFRGIRSPNGDAYINVGDNVVEIVAGETKFTVSKQQISTYCDIVDYNMPTQSKGGLFKETGILRFLPNFFVPPFSLPQYLPNVSLLLRVTLVVGALKEFIEEFNKKE